MWLNHEQTSRSAIKAYRESLLNSCPNHLVIDKLFNEDQLDAVVKILQQEHYWKSQRHSYSSLYVDQDEWQKTSYDQRFVQRDHWQGKTLKPSLAQDFLSFLRGGEFMSFLSGIFNVHLTDKTLADPEINTNYFRLGPDDFVEQHADDSPGREVCMLLYLNKSWNDHSGGELTFKSSGDDPLKISPLYNRCILFDPSSKGSEHWVEKFKANPSVQYRYNVTSWYWSE